MFFELENSLPNHWKTCMCFMHFFSLYSHGSNVWSIIPPAKQSKISGWLSRQMFSGIRYGIHVPVWATSSLFNTSCSLQESDTTATRMPPWLTDFALELSRPTTSSKVLKLSKVFVWHRVATDKQWYHRSKLKFTYWTLGSSCGHTTPTAGCRRSLLTTLSFQSFKEPKMQLWVYVHILCFWTV